MPTTCSSGGAGKIVFMAYDAGDRLFKGRLAQKPYMREATPKTLATPVTIISCLTNCSLYLRLDAELVRYTFKTWPRLVHVVFVSEEDVTIAFVVVTKALYIESRRRNGQCCCLRIQQGQRHLIHCHYTRNPSYHNEDVLHFL